MAETPTLARIEHWTDPSCPFAFSAEPALARLHWRFGDQIEWTPRMVVLSDTPEDQQQEGLDPDKLSHSFRALQQAYGMPIEWSPRPRLFASRPACSAVVAARLHAPQQAKALLRALRVRHFAGELLDESSTRDRAAQDAGIDAGELAGWVAGDDAREALQDDHAGARDPSAAARAQDEKLAGPDDERRYTCPSLVISGADEDAMTIDAPGFQPLLAYEVALANVAPQLAPRPDPDGVHEVLDWSSWPLATVEVAAICDRAAGEVRHDLASVGARFHATGGDGYWTAR